MTVKMIIEPCNLKMFGLLYKEKSRFITASSFVVNQNLPWSDYYLHFSLIFFCNRPKLPQIDPIMIAITITQKLGHTGMSSTFF